MRESRFSVELFMPQSAENLRREYFTVALLSGSEKVWRRRGVGGIKILRRRIIVSQCRKFSYGNPLLLHFFGYRKKLEKKGGVSRLSVENFLSHSAENLRREYFTVALLSGSEKVWRRGGVGGIKILRRKFIVSQCRKFSYGNP